MQSQIDHGKAIKIFQVYRYASSLQETKKKYVWYTHASPLRTTVLVPTDLCLTHRKGFSK
jgi:hypothetical protein